MENLRNQSQPPVSKVRRCTVSIWESGSNNEYLNYSNVNLPLIQLVLQSVDEQVPNLKRLQLEPKHNLAGFLCGLLHYQLVCHILSYRPLAVLLKLF